MIKESNKLESMLNSSKHNNPYDYVFYFRIFEGCNVHCDHCFIPSNPKRMTIKDIEKAVDTIKGIIGEKESNILIQWHGGEPTIMGSDFINRSMDILLSKLPYSVDFGIQTNLTLLDDGLLNIYKTRIKKGQFGVSWDTDIRELKNKDNFEKTFWINYKTIIESGIVPVVTMTSTKQFFNKFDNFIKLYTFCLRKNINELHIERLTKTGYARKNWESVGVTNKEYSIGMSKLLDGYVKEKGERDSNFNLSPFDGLMKSVYSLANKEQYSYGCWSGGCDTGFHTIDSNGYKAGCTALNSEDDNKVVLKKTNGLSFVDKDIAKDLIKRRLMCEECEFTSICSSGCGALDFNDGSGECSGAKTLFLNILSKI